MASNRGDGGCSREGKGNEGGSYRNCVKCVASDGI